MYEYLNGIIEYLGLEYLVVDINGIGYKVFTSQNTASSLKPGAQHKIYTHLVVKEDDLVLYGFSSRDELEMFRLLITVSGVGPKVAVSLLSAYKAQDLAAAIVIKDASKLTKASGIGKKIAERIILELKDKIDTEKAIQGDIHSTNSDETAQVIEALVALGYNYNMAASAVAKLTDRSRPIDVLIKEALRQLSTL